MRMKWSALALASVAAFVALTNARLRSAPVIGEWRAYNGSYASTRYSPLDQINKDTVKNCDKIAIGDELVIPTTEPDVVNDASTEPSPS